MWLPAMLGFVPDQVVRPSWEGVGVVREGCNSALTPVYSAGLAKAQRAGRIGGRPSLVVDRDRLTQLDEEGYHPGDWRRDGNLRGGAVIDA
jgi:hypothetical protein